MLLVLMLGGKEEAPRKGKRGGPFGWLVRKSYKRESLVAMHGRRETTLFEAKSLTIHGVLEM